MWGKEAGSMTARTKKEEHKMNFILDCDIIKYIKETCTTARFGRKV